jgi:hypothetical protein
MFFFGINRIMQNVCFQLKDETSHIKNNSQPLSNPRAMNLNPCTFSPDRLYRYTLLHEWDQIFQPRLAAVIALNPSTADEADLDPTLRRIRSFCMAEKMTGFCMLNLFGYRATNPVVMKTQADPVGPDNDRHILEWAQKADRVIVAWGTHGNFRQRDSHVLSLLRQARIQTFCWGFNQNGSPKHPLYLPQSSPLLPFQTTAP